MLASSSIADSKIMAVVDQRIIAICQLGGVFEVDTDGSFFYKGGDAHAIDITGKTKFDEFKLEIFELFNLTSHSLSVKYFLPGNRKTLITVSNDKDLQRMLRFHGDSSNVDVFITMNDDVPNDGSNYPTCKSSGTTTSGVFAPADSVMDTVDADSNFHDYMGGVTHAHVSTMVPQEQVDTSADNYNSGEIADMMGDGALPVVQSCSKTARYWQKTISSVGQRFNSVHEFRETLRRYAISHQFAFRYKKNDNNRVTVKCKAEGCSWRIHASKLSTTQLICIKKMNLTHTCNGASSTTGYQATRTWVASVIKEKLKVSPQYKPKDIIDDIQQEYGIRINYYQAWRGKEIAKEELVESFTSAYSQLPIFCEKISKTHPGSYTDVAIKDDHSFQGLFVSLGASLFGFQSGCRPILFLDTEGISQTSEHRETLLSATAIDGDDKVFPVAFAIVDAEIGDNWHWFLKQLKNALGDRDTGPLTFVADREKGLKESISEIFPGSFHGYCVRYLGEQLLRDVEEPFSNEVKSLLVSELHNAAYALTADAFHGHLESIKKVSRKAFLWIQQSEPSNWANFLFLGARYNHLFSNFAGDFYRWASESNKLPITEVCDIIRGKIMDLIYMRKVESDQWLTRLTPTKEDKLHEESLKGRYAAVSNMTGNMFEVQGDSVEQVDLEHYTCSCRQWQLSGMPCRHALNVISCVGANPYEYCSIYFSIGSYKATYAMPSLLPFPETSRPTSEANDSSQAPVIVNPPAGRRAAGRPNAKKPVQPDPFKRELRCSNCKGTGHNRKTCKE